MNKTLRSKLIPLLALALVSIPLGSRAADMTSPIAALKSIGDAMQAGDAATVKGATTNIKPEIIDGMCEMMKSSTALHDVAVSKFGPDGEHLGVSPKVSMNAQLDNAKVVETGDTATVTPTMGQALNMTKVDGAWKLDFGKVPEMQQAGKMMPMMTKMAAVNRTITDGIAAGKFATAADAKKAYSKQLMSVMMPTTMPQPSSTQPE